MSWLESSSLPWHGVNYANDLNPDEAYLNLTSIFYDTVRVYSLSSDCEQCPFSYVTSLNESWQIIPVSTKHDSIWRFYEQNRNDTYKSVDDNKKLLCQIDEKFAQFGVYDIIVDEKNCEFSVTKEPVNIYLPLLVVGIGLLVLYTSIELACRWRSKKTGAATGGPENRAANVNEKSRRILSIDTFRGFSLCLMIFVNDGGGQYWFFNHSTWDGLYPADVLFPWFLWIMGACIALSQKTLAKQSVRMSVLTKNILQRAALLFLFGLSLNTLGVGPVNIGELRIPGVLQRISICYAAVSLISVFVWKLQVRLFSSFNYLMILLPQWIIHLCILYIHYYLTFYLSVPACPRGYLGVGGIQNDNLYSNCTGGATGYIDRILLGEKHMYQHAAVRHVYHTPVPFDPENILGCLTSIFQTFVGMQAGFILRRQESSAVCKMRHLLMCSILSLSLGLTLHYSNAIPLNKNLWSLSFVFATSGLAFLVFAAFYYVIDHARVWNGAPFIYPGTNSILVYVGHELCFQLFPWHWKLGTMNTHFLLLVENIWGVILWMLITYVLFEKRIFFNL